MIRNIAAETDLYCFAGEMRQLFANLVGNALDASNEGGRLFLDVRRSRFAGDGSVGVRVFVADNGCGMTAETRRRIFEPFFTTKDDTGTGLGLWVSDEIIHKHNGRVRVRSRFREPSASEGKSSGTIFMIFFPEDGIGPAPQSAAGRSRSTGLRAASRRRSTCSARILVLKSAKEDKLPRRAGSRQRWVDDRRNEQPGEKPAL